MLPMQMGPMTTNEQTDGETLNLLTYVRLRPGLARGYDPAKDPQNAEELLKRFILRAASNPKVAVCFKEIGIILNLDEVERNGANKMLVGLIRKYNGKPVLTRPEHYFHIDPQRRYMAVDLDGHRYKYLTRTAVDMGIGVVEDMDLGYGYVIEGKQTAELPEVMACCCRIIKLQKARAKSFPPGSN